MKLQKFINCLKVDDGAIETFKVHMKTGNRPVTPVIMYKISTSRNRNDLRRVSF